jgi:hypothetical protein
MTNHSIRGNASKAAFLKMSLLERTSEKRGSDVEATNSDADDEEETEGQTDVGPMAAPTPNYNFLGSRMPATGSSDSPTADGTLPTNLFAMGDADNVNPDALSDMTSASMEAAITDLMMGKTKFGATPMGGSVRKIKNLLAKSMVPKVEAAHRGDQLELDRLAEEIVQCGSTRNSAFRGAKDQLTVYKKESRLHKRCRSDEAVRYSSKENCIMNQKSKYQVKVLKCQAFAHISRKYGTTVNNKGIVDKSGSEGMETYVRRLSRTFCGVHNHGPMGMLSGTGGWGGGLKHGMLDIFLKAKEGCQIATKQYLKTVKECKRKTHAYNVRKSQCNQYQSLMDGAACKRAVLVKDACESYASCYYSKVKAYKIVDRRVRFEERDRKAEWRGLKRMECLINSFADGKVSQQEVETCKGKTLNTDHLDIKYPDMPELVKCVVPTLYPATGAYKRAEFAPLPTLAKGRDSAECSGMQEVETKPAPGSPNTCKCTRVALNGYYSAGPLVKCVGCLDARRSLDKNSCPPGTKVFSPASREDWKTLLGSVAPLRDPDWIIDITRPDNGCGGCTSNAMNSRNNLQQTWKTSDGSPWWLRSTRYSEPNGDYAANCYMQMHNFGTSENSVQFNDERCNYHSKSYYCQPVRLQLKPKDGSPSSCKCTKVDLTGQYSPGALVKCEHCLTVYRSIQKNSCPQGMKIFSPRSRADWRTFLRSATPLRAPNWIIDVTRPQNGCGGCTKYPMRSKTPQQATWRTSDGSVWWLRDRPYTEPNGDYYANCFLDIWKKPASPSSIAINDQFCNYHSRSYYCQPIKASTKKKLSEPPPPPPRRLVPWSQLKQGLSEEIFYFEQGSRVPNLRGRSSNKFRRVDSVNYKATDVAWSGFTQADNYAVRWSGFLIIRSKGLYRFALVSDDGSKLYVDNKYIINNDGVHSMKRREGSKRCTKGQHYLRIEYFEKDAKAGMQFMYKGKDTHNEMVTVKGRALRFLTARGFKEEAYYTSGDVKVVPNLGEGAAMMRVVPHVVYANSKGAWPGFTQADNFACRWTGNLEIKRGGRYRFSLISDDGSRFFVSDKKTVDNDGLHSLKNQEGIITLKRKWWPIKLEFFERTGHAGMVFRYMGFDTDNKMKYVPRTAMWVAY